MRARRPILSMLTFAAAALVIASAVPVAPAAIRAARGIRRARARAAEPVTLPFSGRVRLRDMPACGFTPVPPTAFAYEGETELERRLDEQRVTLAFDGEPIEAALAWLSAQTEIGITVALDARVLIWIELPRVSLPRLRDLTAKSALNLILAAQPELTYELREDSIVIAVRDD